MRSTRIEERSRADIEAKRIRFGKELPAPRGAPPPRAAAAPLPNLWPLLLLLLLLRPLLLTRMWTAVALALLLLLGLRRCLRPSPPARRASAEAPVEAEQLEQLSLDQLQDAVRASAQRRRPASLSPTLSDPLLPGERNQGARRRGPAAGTCLRKPERGGARRSTQEFRYIS